MNHSVTFTMLPEGLQKNTWRDWGLIPASRPIINPPEPKIKNIDIPGRDGYLDLSTAMTGYLVYKNRTGSMEFYVGDNQRKDWSELYSEISFFLNGRQCYVVLEDVVVWHYIGSVRLNEWESVSDGSGSKVVIDYDLQPYSYFYKTTTNMNTMFDCLEVHSGPIYEHLCEFSLPGDYNFGSENNKWVIASSVREFPYASLTKKPIPWNLYYHEEMPQVLSIVVANIPSGVQLYVVFYQNVKETDSRGSWDADRIAALIQTNGSHKLSNMILGPFSEIQFQLRTGDNFNASASAIVALGFTPGRL